MKNNENKIILILIFSIISIIVVIFTVVFLTLNNDNKEVETNLTINCDKISSSELQCKLEGNSSYEVSAVSATIEYTNGKDKLTVEPDSSWEGNGEDGQIEFYTDTNKKGNFPIATVTVDISEDDNYDINIINVSYFNSDFKANKVDKIVKDINV